MKRLWPYWLFPALHFAIIGFAAFGVHYSNGINVHGFAGDYGFWMDIGNLGNSVFQFTLWLIPVILFLWWLLAREKRTEGIWFLTAAFAVLIVSWPFYSGLISFWERNWLPP